MPNCLFASIVALVSAIVLAAGNTFAVEQLRARFDPIARRVEVSVSGLGARLGYELRCETAGVREVEKGADVGEPGIIYLPPRTGRVSLTAKPEIPAGAENVFFFHDFTAAEGWMLVARFDSGVSGRWKLNGRFSKLGGEFRGEIVIPVGELVLGENLLHFVSEGAPAPTLCYRRGIPARTTFSAFMNVSHANWSGRLALWKRDGAGEAVEVSNAVVKGASFAPRETRLPERWWQDRAMIEDSVFAVGENLLRAQVGEGDPFAGGFYLVYDPQRRSYRMPHWIWSWGPAIKLLLDLEQRPAARASGAAPRFRAAALAAARRSLEFGMTDPAHPAFGVSTVRWEPSRATPNGWAEYISTADSLFLAGWGWMPAYAATKDTVFLERTRQLVAAAVRLMDQYPVVPQDWVIERERWTPHTLDESVFGMIGFRELHAATQSEEASAAGRRFLDSHLKHMGRPSGQLERAWMREEDKAIWEPDIKGHAWVVEGYLDAYRLSGDPKYFALARSLSDQVLECQDAGGAWTYLFKKPHANDPLDDKGTAIWAYFLYDVYRETRDARYLDAARRALGWCLRQQYRGGDPHLDGAVLHPNSMAYVRRRPMTILYTNTFFALALLEELALTTPR